MFEKFNRWYDSHSDGTRFVIFLAMISLATIPLNFGIRTINPILAIGGLVMLLFMCGVAFVRAGIVHGKVAQFGIAVLTCAVVFLTVLLVFF